MKLFKIAAFALIAVLSLTQTAQAACIAGAPCIISDYTKGTGAHAEKRGDSRTCDGDFMNQIYARAFLEASRETMIAQTYIRKPDSTLEYTCFDEFLDHVADNAPPLFSETNDWLGKMIFLNIANVITAGNPVFIPMAVAMGPGHIVPPLTLVVSSALNEHVQNFNHDFLGGTGGMNSSISPFVSPGNYNCGSMAAIWDIAKCQNFPDGPTLFTTFAELAAADPRQFPALGACTSPITTDLITTARNAGPGFGTADFDSVDLSMDRVLPATSDAECLLPVDTGITNMVYNFVDGPSVSANPAGVDRTGVEIRDKVCVNPGCYYHVNINFATGTITGEECRKG